MRWCLFLFAILLSSCASTSGETDEDLNKATDAVQQAYELEQFIQKWERLNLVHSKVMAANADLCERTHLNLGVIMHQLSDYPLELQEFVGNRGSVTEFPTILSIQDDGLKPILQPGDVILNRYDDPSFPHARDVQEYMIAGFIRIMRGEEKMILPVKAPRACSYRSALRDDKRINASAENGEIHVTTALMDIAISDDELGFIISHELAHYVKEHIQVIIHGEVVSSAKTRKKTSREQEIEADYAGLYYATRAGYNYKTINNFWGRIKSTSFFSFFSFLSSYPNIKEREAFLTQVGEEIEEKTRLNHPIEP